jgi:hypothetical protein
MAIFVMGTDNSVPIGVTSGAVTYCDHELINDSADCINKFVRSIYQYHPRKDAEQIDFDELMEEGGDCGSWSRFYYEAGLILGKHSEEVTFPSKGFNQHRVTIWSDETGYCVLDNQNYVCAMWGEPDV